MEITTHNWKDIDFHEVAQLTHAAKGQPGGETVEWIVNWLGEQFAQQPRFATLARLGERLVGWLMLVGQNPAKVEINPWYLGGHPLIAPDQDHQEVGARLLQEAMAWARDQGFEVVELCIDKDLTADPQVYDTFSAWYASLGFGVREESVGFFCRLSALDQLTLATPQGVELWPVTDVDQEELYHCYHATLTASRSGFFLDQGEREKRAYFDSLGKLYGLHPETSLALIQDGQIIGFSYTTPFGEHHLFLDWIGIHPDVRRLGLGRFLLQTMVERAAQAGFQTMGLGCDVQNAQAIALYRSLGWQPAGDADIKYAAKL